MTAFGSEGAGRIAAAIRTLDPEGKFVKLDPGARTIEYSPEIKQHNSITTYDGEEEPTRAYIICWLCTKGGYLPANLELEKHYSIGRRARGERKGARLDILVKRADGTPYALIEVKSPQEYNEADDETIEGQLYNLAVHEPGCAVLSLSTVALSGDDVAIRALTINYTNHPVFADWRVARPRANEIPANHGEPVHVHFRRNGPRDLRRDVTQQEFDKLRRTMHDVLWRGSVPDNIVYENVVMLFLAKIHDERSTHDQQDYEFQIIYDGSTREPAAATVKRVEKRYREAYRRYLGGRGAQPSQREFSGELSDEQIAWVVELLQGIALTGSHTRNADVLGAFFEGITREGFKQSKGLFFTHLNIVVFILTVLEVEELAAAMIGASAAYADRLPRIIDPSCGSGTFLLEAMQLITAHVTKHRGRIAANEDAGDFLNTHFPAGHENLWAKDFLYGVEMSELLSMAAKVNMVLRRDGNTKIFHADGLAPLSSYADPQLKGAPHPVPRCYSKAVANAFDVVVSNPPFSITLDPQTTRQLKGVFELADDPNSENLFLERWYQLLKPGGRLGAVLPESFFSTKENLHARLFLYAHFDIKAIVSLPRQAFEPWTPTRVLSG